MKTKSNKGKYLLIGIIVLLLAGSGGFVYLNSGESANTSKALIGTLIQTVSDNGVIESEGTIILPAKTTMEVTMVYVNEGDYVKAGDILLSNNDKTTSLDISSLRAQAAGIGAQAANANTVAANSKVLLEAGAISQAEYNGTRAAASQLNAQLASLNYSIESFRQGAGVGGLTTPVSGYITELFAKQGETISAGGSVVEISPLAKFTVVLNLIPEDAVKVNVGDQVTLKQDNIVLSTRCTVERISKKAKDVLSDMGVSQKRIEVIIGVPETAEGLILGNNVDTEILTESLKNKLMVPSEAIFEKENLKWVYLVKDGKARLTEIKTGVEGDKNTEIINGIKEGDVVILSPGNNITDGEKIK